MKEYFQVLRRCVLFDQIEDENLLAMLGCLGGSVLEFGRNETILAEGDPAKYIGIVLSGEAQIVRIDYYGNRSLMANVGVSQLFGESFACAGVEAMPVDVVASEVTKVLLVDCRRIIGTCSHACRFHSQVIFNLLKVVATKNLVFHQKLEVTSKRSTREKLMAYLLQQAKEQKSSSFTIPYDRQELADYLEVERSGLSAEIGKLCKEGRISCKKSWFVLHSAE